MAVNPLNQRELKIPFGVNEFGEIAFETSPEAIYIHRITTVIGTAVGERLMRGGYGSDAAEFAFEIIDDITLDSLSSSVQTAIETWEPGVLVREVRTTADAPNARVLVEVLFSIAPSGLTLSDGVEQIYSAQVSIAGTVTEF